MLGVTMNIPVSCKVSPRGCCGADAALVCCDIGIPHYFIDVAEAFDELIIEPFQRVLEDAISHFLACASVATGSCIDAFGVFFE